VLETSRQLRSSRNGRDYAGYRKLLCRLSTILSAVKGSAAPPIGIFREGRREPRMRCRLFRIAQDDSFWITTCYLFSIGRQQVL
jgi:hypothetical protein